MAARTFTVPPEMQQLIMGFGSRALANVTLNTAFTSEAPVLPLNPSAVRRSLIFSVFEDAEFDVFIQNLDGTSLQQVTEPRAI